MAHEMNLDIRGLFFDIEDASRTAAPRFFEISVPRMG